MWSDPIIEEIHKFRDEHAARFGYDIDKLLDDIQAAERCSDQPAISLMPRMEQELLVAKGSISLAHQLPIQTTSQKS